MKQCFILILTFCCISLNLAISHETFRSYETRLDDFFFQQPLSPSNQAIRKHGNGIQTKVSNYDTVITYQISGVPAARYTQHFDAEGRIIGSRQELWDVSSNSWRNSAQWNMKYVPGQNTTVRSDQTWSSYTNDWENYFRYTTEYDDHDSIISELTEMWDSSTGDWTRIGKSVARRVYDTQTSSQIVFPGVEDSPGTIRETSKNTYTFDARGHLITSLHQDINSNGDLINTQMFTLKYDSNGNLVTILREQWQSNQWHNSEKYTYTYDEHNNRLSELYSVWRDNTWKDNSPVLYSYDANGNLITETTIAYDTTFRATLTYDNEGNSTSGIVEKLVNGSWQRAAHSLAVYAGKKVVLGTYGAHRYNAHFVFLYDAPTDVNEIENPTIEVYPNPTTGSVNIGLCDYHNAVISVYNLQNQLLTVSESYHEGKTLIDMSAFSSGLYIVHIIADNGVNVIRTICKE